LASEPFVHLSELTATPPDALLSAGSEAVLELRQPYKTFLGFLLAKPETAELFAQAKLLANTLSDAKAAAVKAHEAAQAYVANGWATSYEAALAEFGGSEAVTLLALDVLDVSVAFDEFTVELVAAVTFRVNKDIPPNAAAIVFAGLATEQAEDLAAIEAATQPKQSGVAGILFAAAAVAAIVGIGAVATTWSAEKLVVSVEGASDELQGIAASTVLPLLLIAATAYLVTR
jgi:hypothetical protein